MISRSRRAVARRRRGGGFLLIMLVGIPMMLFGVSLSADYGIALAYNRMVADTAENMAMAAGSAFNPNVPGQLSPASQSIPGGNAVQRAQDLYRVAFDTGMITRSTNVSRPTITMVNGNTGLRVVFQVSVPLMIPSAILRIVGRDPITADTTITRSVYVCQPNFPGGCMYPIGLN